MTWLRQLLDWQRDVSAAEEFVESVKTGLYTSVMYDGSSLPFEKNVKNTTRIVKLAHARGISVEAELGAIAGIEDFSSGRSVIRDSVVRRSAEMEAAF